MFSWIMGNSNSTLGIPDGVTQLNNSVWEFYKPEGLPSLEVIFFHGLQLSDYREAFWKTWRSRDNSVIWPKEWLGPALQNARISSVSYDSSAQSSNKTGGASLYPIIENLLQDVVICSNFKIDPTSKVILVGHSMGGLIIKQLLLKCLEEVGLLSSYDFRDAPRKDRIENFLRSCRGVFYYSTPHLGSELAAYADRVKYFPRAHLNMPIIEFLKVLSSETAQINNKFANVRRGNLNQIATGAIGELCNTSFAGLSMMVVSEASARHDVDSGYYSAHADHFQVCKAENNSFSPIFKNLKDFCESRIDETPLDSLPAPTHRPLAA